MFFSSWPREHISLRRRSFSVSDRNGPLLLSTVEQPAWAAWTLLSRRPLSTPKACLHPRAVQTPLRKNPANRPPVPSVFPCCGGRPSSQLPTPPRHLQPKPPSTPPTIPPPN